MINDYSSMVFKSLMINTHWLSLLNNEWSIERRPKINNSMIIHQKVGRRLVDEWSFIIDHQFQERFGSKAITSVELKPLIKNSTFIRILALKFVSWLLVVIKQFFSVIVVLGLLFEILNWGYIQNVKIQMSIRTFDQRKFI